MAPKDPLRKFAEKKGIRLASQSQISAEAALLAAQKTNFDADYIKQHFDELIEESEQEIYNVYLKHEKAYEKAVVHALIEDLIAKGEITSLENVGEVIGNYAPMLDKFFQSVSQGRKPRAGGVFENIYSTLFKAIGYPFEEQPIIDEKPDFILPSHAHYQRDPMDCIIFTSKRTLRERWRQIVLEGAKSTSFFLATIDKKISANQFADMHSNRIYIVCPNEIKKALYTHENVVNVLSFSEFFMDYVDPAIERWKRKGILK